MSTESFETIYTIDAALLPSPTGEKNGRAGARRASPILILYCDNCGRWGITGVTHDCGRNWWPRLSDLITATTDSRRR